MPFRAPNWGYPVRAPSLFCIDYIAVLCTCTAPRTDADTWDDGAHFALTADYPNRTEPNHYPNPNPSTTG